MARATQEKPGFREVGVATMNLDNGLVFNSQRVGPINFHGLRKADYGEGFRMPSFHELVPLVHASLENSGYATAKAVVQTLKSYWLIGNTGILWTPRGMYVQDSPEVRKDRIYINEKDLENELSATQERGVIYSDNRSVRFTPLGFQIKGQTALNLSKNPGIIALVNGEENAEKLAESSQHYRLKPYLFGYKQVDSPIISVLDLNSGLFGDRLGVDAYYSECCGGRYSFGRLAKTGEASSH